MTCSDVQDEKAITIEDWKYSIFSIIFTCIALLGFFPYLKSISAAVKTGLSFNVISYSVNYGLVFIILFGKPLNIRFRSILGIGSFYLLGLTAIITVGPAGSGRVWFFSLSIMASLLLGRRASIITIFLNAVILVLIGFFISGDAFVWQLSALDLSGWITTSITFIFLNTVLTVATSLLETAQINNIKRERALTDELRESQNKLIQALEGTHIAFYIIDINHIVTHWNSSCSRLSGLSKDNIIGSNEHWRLFYEQKEYMLADYIIENKNPETETDNKAFESKSIAGGLEAEISMNDKDGKTISYYRMAAPIKDRNGNMVGAIENIIDISHMKNMEGQLIHAQKMESIGQLAGGVAHDYNNISSIVIGYSELALAETEPDTRLHSFLKEIYKASIKSAGVTKQLLAFARKQTIKPICLDINGQLKELSKMLNRLIGEDISFELVLGTDLSKVLIDPTQLDQILSNLCINARDAIHDTGKITIETRMTEIDEDYSSEHLGFKAGTFVMIAVSDSGCGIDKQTLDHIFEPFYTTKGEKGTGLGLATVYGIVKQNNGFINVYSEPGSGTVFRIYLPPSSPICHHQGDFQEKEAGTADYKDRTILVVEDDKTILKLEKKILERLGYIVLDCQSPEEAINKVKRETGQIDLLITDVVMPGMNGKKLSEKIKAVRPEIKVLFTSGHTENVIASKGILKKGINYLPKPFTKKDLDSYIKEVLNT